MQNITQISINLTQMKSCSVKYQRYLLCCERISLKQGSVCESKSFTDILLYGDYCHGCGIL